MSPLLLAAWFDGWLLTIPDHPIKWIAASYVVPLVLMFVVTKVMRWPIPFSGMAISGLQWLATPGQSPIGAMTLPQLMAELLKAGFAITKPPSDPPPAS